MFFLKAVQKPTGYLLISCAVLFFAKIILISLMQSPWVVDGFVYAQTARAIINQLSFVPLNLSSADYQFYPPGYPLAISIAYLFSDQELAYRVTLIINAFLTTLVIPFTYYLALHYLDSNRALITAVVLGFSPTLIPYIFVIMSENLFIPLFMLTILVLYSATSSMHAKNWLFSGLLTGFLVLVRIQGIAMVAGLFAVLLGGLIRKTIDIKNTIAALLGLLIILGPYLLYRLYQTTTVTGYQENYYMSNLYSALTTTSGFLTFLRLTVNELGYLYVCGLGILTLLGCLFVINSIKDKHLSSKYMIVYFSVSAFITVFITVLHMFGAYHGQTDNPQFWYEVFGRYLDPIMTPLMAFGLIYLFNHNSFSWRIRLGLMFTSIIFVITFPCGTYHPGATWAIIYLQYFKGIIPYQLVIAFLILCSVIILMRSYRVWFKTLYILIIFLTINLFAANYQIINGRTETIGLWIKQQVPPARVVYVDKSTYYHERLWRSVVFWNPSLKVDYLNLKPEILTSELVQLKLNIGASGGDSTPPEVKRGAPTYRSGSLRNLDKITFTNRRTLLITDKPFSNPASFDNEFQGNKVYEIKITNH